MSSTTRLPERQSPTDDRQSYRRSAVVFGWLAAVLGIAVLGLVMWILVGDDTPELSVEQQQMIETIDGYIAAWNHGDGAAADALMDPNGYLEDVGGRWYVAENGHSNYLESLHMMGFQITRSEPVFVGNVVVVTHQYAEGSTNESPNIYYMDPDGTRIRWVLEPYPLDG